MFDVSGPNVKRTRAFKFTSLHSVDNIQNYHVPYIMCKKKKKDVKSHGLILYNK